MMVMQTKNKIPNLGYLLQDMVPENVVIDVPVNSLRIDSREVTPGDLFIALDGSNINGKEFIGDAITNGAVAVLLETTVQGLIDNFSIPIFGVVDLKSKLGLLANRFYGDPSRDLKITGITGTNGKTSVAFFLAEIMAANGKLKVGSIGTLGSGIFGELKSSVNTTPDVISINKLLSEFRSLKIKDVVIEVSSHGLEKGRINNINFDTAVFTNLSRDHLDFHGDMSLYGESKKKLFEIQGLKNAVINTDDEFGARLYSEINGIVNKLRYALVDNDRPSSSSSVDIIGNIIKQDIDSLLLHISSPWGQGEVCIALSGRFNAYNILACLGVLCAQGMAFDEALHGLSMVQGVPGRMEYFGTPGFVKIFIDYSHTPDALEQALGALRKQCKGKLVCVFGCGGNRDKGKRPEMGRVADQYADRVFLTNDNPRTEPAEKIIEDIKAGLSGTADVEIIIDRSTAIRQAILTSDPDDFVLIAGKGHETYQEIGRVKYPFSDRQQVRNLMDVSK